MMFLHLQNLMEWLLAHPESHTELLQLSELMVAQPSKLKIQVIKFGWYVLIYSFQTSVRIHFYLNQNPRRNDSAYSSTIR